MYFNYEAKRSDEHDEESEVQGEMYEAASIFKDGEQRKYDPQGGNNFHINKATMACFRDILLGAEVCACQAYSSSREG